MTKCTPIQIQTPKKFLLDGLFFGSDSNKTVFIFIHGLGGNIFSQLDLTDLVEDLADKKVSALTFNNRGSGVITKVKQLDAKSKKGYKSHLLGCAHETFTDCIDDIDGAINFVLKQGAKDIFLVGHSTGCQKIVYYLSQKTKALVSGAVLLAPISDYAGMLATTEKKVYVRALQMVQKMIKLKRGHELLPDNIWPYPIDAERFISLFTLDSVEEIFTYATGRKPKLLQKVTKPLLVVLAEKDEYSDQPVEELVAWFKSVLKGDHQVEIIVGALHGFNKQTKALKEMIKSWAFKLI